MTAHTARLPEIHGALIFESTWAGSLAQKATTLGAAGLFWAAWLSMWLPLATMLIWTVAPAYGTDRLFAQAQTSIPTITLVTAAGVSLGAFLTLWGTLQWLHASPLPKAPELPSVTRAELAAWHNIDDQVLGQAWTSRRLVIHHSEDGKVTRIDASMPFDEASCVCVDRPSYQALESHVVADCPPVSVPVGRVGERHGTSVAMEPTPQSATHQPRVFVAVAPEEPTAHDLMSRKPKV